MKSKELANKIWKQSFPDIQMEYKFHPVRKWRFDYAFPKQKVAIEIQGGIWIGGRHSRGFGIKKDMEKFTEAALLGWRILYFQPSEMLKQETMDKIYDAIVQG